MNFNNLIGPKKMRDNYVGPFLITKLIGKNAIEVKLTEEFGRKHPVFPVSLAKKFKESDGDKFPNRETRKDFIPIEQPDTPGPVKYIIKSRLMRINGKDLRQYLVRFKKQSADNDKWLTEKEIPDAQIHLRNFRASKRSKESHQ